MAIIPMKKIRLMMHRKDGSAILDRVQKLGCIEFHEVSLDVELKKEEKTNFEFNRVVSRLDFAVNFLLQFEEKKSSIASMIEGDRIRTNGENIESLIKKSDFDSCIDELVSIEGKINANKAELKEINGERKVLEEWSFLNVPIGKLKTKKTEAFLLKGSVENMEALEREMEEKNIVNHFEKNGFYGILAILSSDRENVSEIIGKVQLESVSLSCVDVTPKERLEQITKREEVLNKELVELENSAKKYTKDIPNFKIMSDYIRWKKDKHNLLTSASRTEKALVFEGWCPEAKLSVLESDIEKITPSYVVEIIEPNEGEETPVEIENRGLIKSFESVTRLYGLPGYNDLDPTLFFSAFFFIFFGLCLTDVGYGIFLVLVLGFILLRYKVPKESKPLIVLLLLGGVSSALIGLLFGGYLGISMDLFPEWVQKLQKFDPIASPMPVLILSLVLGVIQVMFGLFLKIVRDAKNGELRDGLLDQVPWLLFFVSFIIFGLAKLDMFFGVNTSILVYSIIGSAVLIVLTQSRKGDTVIGKAFKGVLSLYDSVGYFSDILSYSRILALGLATSALAFAVNLIAVLLRDMIPVVGPIIMVLVLIIGHLFNIVVNLLGAFIHSARLQFVEFFSKFIAGSGRQFRPFKREEKYVVVTED